MLYFQHGWVTFLTAFDMLIFYIMLILIKADLGLTDMRRIRLTAALYWATDWRGAIWCWQTIWYKAVDDVVDDLPCSVGTPQG